MEAVGGKLSSKLGWIETVIMGNGNVKWVFMANNVIAHTTDSIDNL